MSKEPDWTLKLEEWGTNKEIEDLEYAHKKKYPTTGNIQKKTRNETPSQTPETIGNYISVGKCRKISTREKRRNILHETSNN